jgi:hypothetical protein
LAQLGPFHWHDVEPRRAARVALGVVVPLGLGWATGHVGYGAYVVLAALRSGFLQVCGSSAICWSKASEPTRMATAFDEGIVPVRPPC